MGAVETPAQEKRAPPEGLMTAAAAPLQEGNALGVPQWKPSKAVKPAMPTGVRSRPQTAKENRLRRFFGEGEKKIDGRLDRKIKGRPKNQKPPAGEVQPRNGRGLPRPQTAKGNRTSQQCQRLTGTAFSLTGRPKLYKICLQCSGDMPAGTLQILQSSSNMPPGIPSGRWHRKMVRGVDSLFALLAGGAVSLPFL